MLGDVFDTSRTDRSLPRFVPLSQYTRAWPAVQLSELPGIYASHTALLVTIWFGRSAGKMAPTLPVASVPEASGFPVPEPLVTRTPKEAQRAVSARGSAGT